MINQKNFSQNNYESENCCIHKKGSDIMEYQKVVRESVIQSTSNNQSNQMASEHSSAVIMVPETLENHLFSGVDEELMRRLRG